MKINKLKLKKFAYWKKDVLFYCLQDSANKFSLNLELIFLVNLLKNYKDQKY